MVKLAGLTEIATAEVQDMIYQNMKADTKFEEIKENITQWISNRVAAGSVGMQVGCVQKGTGGEQEDGEQYGEDCDGTAEVNLLKCYEC